MELRNTEPTAAFDPLAAIGTDSPTDAMEDLFAIAEAASAERTGSEISSAVAAEASFLGLPTVSTVPESAPAMPEADPESFADPLAAYGLTARMGEPEKTAVSGVSEKFRDLVGFLGRYFATSSVIFGVMLVGMNYSAYSTIVMNWISPDAVKASSNAVIEGLMKSKITAYASESESGSFASESAEEIKKKLEESNVAIKENILSPKKLVPAKPQLSVDFDVVPYENRLIIPKIGKNIPLVDVESGNGVDFDHMENIFMRELEKGVIRYPGTARPGEAGNAFIFGHSSNFPWLPGSYNQVFALLDELSPGDEIIAYYDQKKYVYAVSEKTVVKPGDVKALSNRDNTKKELSLMTCWPVGTTLKRMLVFAELKSVDPVTK